MCNTIWTIKLIGFGNYGYHPSLEYDPLNFTRMKVTVISLNSNAIYEF